MENKWFSLDSSWQVRSTQDGLELVSSERNISFDIVDPENKRDKIRDILVGRKSVTSHIESEMKDVFSFIESRGILRRQKEKPRIASFSKEEELIWKLRSRFVGSRGPIEIVYRINTKDSKFSPSSYAFTAKYIINGSTTEGWAGGSDKNPVVAELKAIMEGLERWASGVVPEEELLKSTPYNLNKKYIDPRKIVRYADRQYRRKLFPLVPFSLHKNYYWKSVITFPEKKSYYIPVDCLYYPISEKFTPSLYTYASSSGIAAGFSFKSAMIRGLYEAIERDSFMLTWLNRLSAPRINNSTLPQKEQSRIRKFEKLGYKVHIVNIGLDLLPVMLVIVVHNKKKPALLVSGAANFDMKIAMSKALDEVEYILSWQLRYSDRIRNLKNSRKAKGVLDHIAVYSSKNNLSKAKFLWEGPVVSFGKPSKVLRENEFEALVNLFKSRDIKIVTADFTPPSLRKAGIWVVKSMPLGLIPISFGYGLEALGMPRINGVKNSKPWPNNNPFLHPFA